MSAGRGSLRSALIVAQVAVSFVLLIGAGLMLRSLRRLQAVDAGINTGNVLSMRVALNFSKYTTPALRAQFIDRPGRAPARLPGVSSVGAAADVPDERGRRVPHRRPHSRAGRDRCRRGCRELKCSRRHPGYFQTVGIPLPRGRLLDEHDIAGRDRVAVISETMARQFFPTPMPSARSSRPTMASRGSRIVGIVGDVRSTLASDRRRRSTVLSRRRRS